MGDDDRGQRDLTGENRAEPKLGLALSGGGFRAALFHAGVLAQLATARLLRPVRVISSVSGGSIVGALYFLLVRRMLQESTQAVTDDDYVRVVKRLEGIVLEAMEQNIRVRLLTNYPRIVSMAALNYSRSDALAKLLDDYFYDRASEEPNAAEPAKATARVLLRTLEIQSSRPGGHLPTLLINATSLNTGRTWRFGAHTMGEASIEDPDLRDVDPGLQFLGAEYDQLPSWPRDTPLAVAVAASAAVPGMFFPMAISDMYPNHIRVQLVDGGVHDNQGVEGLIRERCTHFVVSDAGGQLADAPRAAPWLLASLMRSYQIQYGRIRQEQLFHLLDHHPDRRNRAPAAIIHVRKGIEPRTVAYLRPGGPTKTAELDPPPDRLTRYGVAESVQLALARIRTDLDAFSEVESKSLMADGYQIADRVLTDNPGLLALRGAQEPLSNQDWVFNSSKIRDLLQNPTPRYLSQLRVAHSRFMKFLFVDVFSLVMVLPVTALLVAFLAVWFGHGISVPFRLRASVGLVLIVVGGTVLLFVVLSRRATLGGLLRFLQGINVVVGYIWRFVLGPFIAGYMWILLKAFNRRFLDAGRVDRVLSPEPRTRRNPFGRFVVMHPEWSQALGLVIAIGVLVLLSLSLFLPGLLPDSGLRTSVARRGIVSLEVARTAIRSNAILDSWGPEGLSTAHMATWHDYVFILIYAPALAFAVLAVGEGFRRREQETLSVIAIGLSWAMWTAGAFDCLENVFLFRMIDTVKSGQHLRGDAVPRLASTFAWAKFGLLVLGVGILVYGVSVWASRRFRQRGIS